MRSCRDVFDVHHARRDALWVEPAEQVSPVAVGEEVPDLHGRKLHPGGGVILDWSAVLRSAEIPRGVMTRESTARPLR